MCWLPHCLYNCWLVVAVPVEATPCFSSLHCFTKNVHFVFFCSQSQPIWVIFVISSRSWWIMQSTGRENNLKHMSALLVDIFNNFCKVACLKFNFLVWQKPSYLRRIHFLREAMQLCSDVDCWCYFLMYVVVYAALWHNTYTHTHTFNGSFSRTTRVSRYQKGKTNLDFTEARDSEWQWHQLGMCKSAPRSRQITTPAPHCSDFLQAGCPSCRPTNSVKALKAPTLLSAIKTVKCASANKQMWQDYFSFRVSHVHYTAVGKMRNCGMWKVKCGMETVESWCGTVGKMRNAKICVCRRSFVHS